MQVSYGIFVDILKTEREVGSTDFSCSILKLDFIHLQVSPSHISSMNYRGCDRHHELAHAHMHCILHVHTCPAEQQVCTHALLIRALRPQKQQACQKCQNTSITQSSIFSALHAKRVQTIPHTEQLIYQPSNGDMVASLSSTHPHGLTCRAKAIAKKDDGKRWRSAKSLVASWSRQALRAEKDRVYLCRDLT